LIPKKVKDLTITTSEELNLPQGLVDDVVRFVWLSLRKEMSQLEAPAIYVDNLGTFKVRRDKLDITILKYNAFINKKNLPRTFQQHAIINDKKIRLNKLINFKSHLDEERTRRKTLKITKNEKPNGDLEGSREDS